MKLKTAINANTPIKSIGNLISIFLFETTYKNKNVNILEAHKAIGTARIDKYLSNNNIKVTFNKEPPTYEIPIYLVSREIETPDDAKGNNKYTDIGIQSRGKYIEASKYPLLLSSNISSGAKVDTDSVISIKARQNVANKFFTSLLKLLFL